MPSVVVRNLSEETKARLAARAARRRHSLEEELRQILDAAARAEAENPDAAEPLGSFIVRITRPGDDGFAQVMEQVVAGRKLPERALPTFE
jgi:plasmid stability protein